MKVVFILHFTEPSEACTMKQAQHTQVIFSLCDFTEPNIGRPG